MELSIWNQCVSASQLHSAEARRADTALRVLVALLQIQNPMLSRLGVFRGSKREGSDMKAAFYTLLHCGETHFVSYVCQTLKVKSKHLMTKNV